MSALSFLVGSVGFAAYVLLFVTLLRLRLRLGWFLLELVLGVVVHVLTSLLGAIWIAGFSYWYNLSLYAFLWFCFFFVSSIYSVSVTLGIIHFLYDKPDHSASLGEIYEYCILIPFSDRVEFLTANGQVQKTKQGYFCTPAGKQTVRRIRWVSTILGMKSKGFYQNLP